MHSTKRAHPPTHRDHPPPSDSSCDPDFSADILDAILVDDSDTLSTLLANLPDVNGLFDLPKFHLPPLLDARPPWAALSVFFRATSCFHLFAMLSFSDHLTDDRNRSLDHFAAAGGDLAIVRELATLGHTFLISDFDLNTPLHYACQMGRVDVVGWLWTHGAALDAVNRMGETPLYIASLMGHLGVVRLLVDEAQLSVAACGSGRGLPIHAACEGGHPAVLQFLIDRRSPLNDLNGESKSPLSLVAISGSLSCLKILLAQPAIVIAVPKRKFTPLVEAAAFGHLDIVKRLVGAGCPVTMPNSQGATPLDAAVHNHHTRIAKYLIEHGALAGNVDVEILMLNACSTTDVELVRLIVESVPIDVAAHPQCREWMEQAIELGARDLLEYFRKCGVRLDGCSIQSVIQQRDAEFVEFLMDQGYDFNAVADEQPLIVFALYTGDVRFVRWLIEKGVVLDRAMLDRYPVVIEGAVRSHNMAMLDFLLSFQPDLSKLDSLLLRNLHWCYPENKRACANVNVPKAMVVAEKLLRAGAVFRNPAYRVIDRSRPFCITEVVIAIQNAGIEFLELFKRYGADLSRSRYLLVDIPYDMPDEVIFGLFRYLDENGVQQLPDDVDGGVAKAMRENCSDAVFDFVMSRITRWTDRELPEIYYELGRRLSALSVAQRCDKVERAVRLLQAGATRLTAREAFISWANASDNEELKALVAAKIIVVPVQIRTRTVVN